MTLCDTSKNRLAPCRPMARRVPLSALAQDWLVGYKSNVCQACGKDETSPGDVLMV